MAFWGEWRSYVPVAQRRAKAQREMNKLQQRGNTAKSPAPASRSAQPVRTPTRRTPSSQPARVPVAAKAVAEPLPKLRPTGKSVARLRRKEGLSVAQFAAKLGVSATTVYRWEAIQGPLNLQAPLLQALAALQQQTKPKASTAPPARARKR